MAKNKWFEIYASRKNGTETIDTAETLKEAKQKVKKLSKTLRKNLYIDQWAIDKYGNTKILGG